MQLIKKYANRKLYHTNQKQYITLEGIARLVQDGEAVQILDNETGNDITSSILAQVVLQARGRSAPQIPTQLLTGLIQIGGDTLANLRRTLATTLAGAEVIDAELERRLDHLVASLQITPEEAKRWRNLLTQTDFGPQNTTLANDVAEVPSRNDVVKLHAQVDALASIVQQLLEQRDPREGK
ncbi:MAG: polyhydroxyalkanoate synthesis regulator DNA-binding domain-containing protein [Oscillochloridaceae bacterium umkhey_bin13]